VTLHEVAGALYIVSEKRLMMHLVRYASDLTLVVESAETRLEQKRLEFSTKAQHCCRAPDRTDGDKLFHALEAATGNAGHPGLMDELAARRQTADDDDDQHQHQRFGVDRRPGKMAPSHSGSGMT